MGESVEPSQERCAFEYETILRRERCGKPRDSSAHCDDPVWGGHRFVAPQAAPSPYTVEQAAPPLEHFYKQAAPSETAASPLSVRLRDEADMLGDHFDIMGAKCNANDSWDAVDAMMDAADALDASAPIEAYNDRVQERDEAMREVYAKDARIAELIALESNAARRVGEQQREIERLRQAIADCGGYCEHATGEKS